MHRRNLFVVFKPIKSNAVLLPDSYFREIQSYENGCLCMDYGTNSHYVAWAPYGGGVAANEIGINSTVAKAIGLRPGSYVKCSLVTDVVVLDSVNVTATTQRDWEMLEVSSYRIQSTILDQTRIVNNGQHLIVWINKAMTILLKINRMKPNASHGRLANNTEVIVAPFGSSISKLTNGSLSNIHKNHNDNESKNSFIERSKSKPEISSVESKQNNTTELSKLINYETKPMSLFSPPVFSTNLQTSNRPTSKDFTEATNQRELNDLLKFLNKTIPKEYWFRVIKNKWEDSQVCTLFLTKYNLPDTLDINDVFTLIAKDEQEYFVNVRILADSEVFPKNIHPTIEMNEILMEQLNVDQFDRICLRQKASITNLIERIQLVPSVEINYKTARDIEHTFKEFILENAKLFPMLINQNEVIKLKNWTISAMLFPESLRYCLLDSEVLRQCRIKCVEEVKSVKVEVETKESNDEGDFDADNVDVGFYVELGEYEKIIQKIGDDLLLFLCLDERNDQWMTHNVLILGNTNSGKSVVCKRILERITKKPYYCYVEKFHCAKHKGRKPESIQKDLLEMFNRCFTKYPAVVVFENLDTLTPMLHEQTQDKEYYDRVSRIIEKIVTEYTEQYPISVIATASSKQNLNKNIYSARGWHLFSTTRTIPDLTKIDREKVIHDLCKNYKAKELNLVKFANLTEGYQLGDLIQFVKRAIFYAHRDAEANANITNEALMESLKNTSAYCMDGVEHNIEPSNSDENDEDNQVMGMDKVVSVLEEVIIWPVKYPEIFENAPIRIPMGILLYGPPGTGKTYLMSKLAKLWHLRMICVKGPELLAKYIGKSEENVREVFRKARAAKPCILFFDEFDSLAPKRGHDSTGVTDRVVNQMLTELDGVVERKSVIVVAATCRPDLLDSALLRSGRLDRHIHCELPNSTERLDIFKSLSRTIHLDKSVNFEYFCDKMNDYTGADIQSILTTANMIAVKEAISKNKVNVPEKVLITQNHLLTAFAETRPSLSKQDIAKYGLCYARFTKKDRVQMTTQRATLA